MSIRTNHSFINTMDFTDHSTVILIKNSEPNPRCGDCQSFRLNPTRCILKPRALNIREYTKCEFFKRDSGKPGV